MATFTIGDVESNVRLTILDTYEDAYRFEPKEIYVAMQEALNRTRSVRPDSRYVNCLLVDLDFPTIPASLDSSSLEEFRKINVNMEERWRECIEYYVIYKMYLKDDADTTNQGLSQHYLNLYNTTVIS